MFSLLLSKETIGKVIPLRACGVKGENSTVVWGTPIEYMLAKYFVDSLNAYELPEEELLEAAHAFVEEIDRL